LMQEGRHRCHYRCLTTSKDRLKSVGLRPFFPLESPEHFHFSAGFNRGINFTTGLTVVLLLAEPVEVAGTTRPLSSEVARTGAMPSLTFLTAAGVDARVDGVLEDANNDELGGPNIGWEPIAARDTFSATSTRCHLSCLNETRDAAAASEDSSGSNGNARPIFAPAAAASAADFRFNRACLRRAEFNSKSSLPRDWMAITPDGHIKKENTMRNLRARGETGSNPSK
jgi:hypothetical protein